MKKAAVFFLLWCSLFLFTGCWNRVEIEDRALLAAMAVDKAAEEGKLEVTAQIIKPGAIAAAHRGGGGSEEAVVVYSDTGHSLFDALRNLARQTGKKLYLAEMAVFIIGEDLAREGIGSITDFWRRDHEANLRSWIIVTKGKGKEVLKTKIPTEKVWAFGLNKMVKAIKAHSKAPQVDVLDFEKKIKSKTTSPVAVGLKLTGEEREPAKEATAPGKKPVINGSAVFRGYKLTGWLNQIESRGMLWVQGKVKSGIILVPSPKDATKPISIEVIRADSEIKPQINDGRITVTVKITEEGNIGEVKPDYVEISKPGVIESIEARQREAIEREVLAAVAKARELNTDVFGFGEAVRRKYPREWPQLEKRWDELFPILDVELEVEVKIRQTGMITDPEPGY